jgi:serine/threonine-protein kinase
MNLAGRSFGHIRVDHMLGQGGMGDVYQGFDVRLARRVALKVLNSEGQLDDEARTRLMREARTLSKLDHPNICRIYDFIDEGDLDVLVLELIDGRTLQEAMNDGLSWADKLRIAHDVASVLVTAHRAGIVHRDLKPENVMLTASGQVKVLDFGLARWIKRKSGKSFPAIASPVRLRAVGDDDATMTAALPPPDDAAAANATAVGLTVGTPLFMSPEQARGEPLTTASDIYSFGLLLQALFTGRDPYPDDLTAHQVMVKASRGDSLPVTGVRHDVAALIKSSKAFAPSDRPTAADALRRIERIMETPKRLARRAAVIALALIAVLGGWKYTVDLRRERTAARKAEAEARQRRAQADSLIEFMLGDLRTKLEPVGRLDILDSVAGRSLDYMSSLNTDLMTPQEIARNSKALNQLGEVRMSQGNLPAAVAVFDKSLSLAQTALKRAPNDPDLALGVALSHYWVGNALRLKGDLAGALAHMREYRRVAETLAAKFPATDEYHVERAYAHSNVGTILDAQGDVDGALAEYTLSLRVRNLRLLAEPSDPKRQADVAVTLNKIGFAQERLGHLTAARDYYQQELSIYETLARSEPKNVHWKERVASTNYYLARAFESLGDEDDALARRAAAVSNYSDLVAHDSANADWRRDLALARCQHANALRIGGQVPEALAEIATSDAAIRDLLAHDATRTSWRRDLAEIDLAYAQILSASRRPLAAREKVAEAVAIYREAVRSVVAVRVIFGEALLVSGSIAAAAADLGAACTSWNEAVTFLTGPGVTASDPRALATIAEARISMGQRDQAQPLIERLHASGYRQGDFERFTQLPNREKEVTVCPR